MRTRAALIAVLLVASMVTLVACSDDGSGAGDAETPTSPPATSEPTASGSPTAPPEIREQDLSQHPVMQDFLNSAGGEVVPTNITYADLTGDGLDEAIVPVGSGGESGNIAVFVFGYGEGGLAALLRAQPQSESIAAEVLGGQLVTTEPVFGPDDPLCCPSELRKVTYGWNGIDLLQTNAETVPAGEPGG